LGISLLIGRFFQAKAKDFFMRSLKRFFARLFDSVMRRRDDEQLQEEIAQHLALANGRQSSLRIVAGGGATAGCAEVWSHGGCSGRVIGPSEDWPFLILRDLRLDGAH
jgi:hypothetical protein